MTHTHIALRMSVVTYDKAVNPLQTAALKINEEFVCQPVTQEAFVNMTSAVFAHTEAQKSVIWSPNWTQKDTKSPFPTGFQFTVDPHSAVFPDLFSRTEMYGVQMAFPLASGAFSNQYKGKKIDESFFSKYHDNIAKSLNDNIANDVLSATSPLNFTGIFASESRTDNGYEKTFYAVTRFSSKVVSDKIFNKIQSSVYSNRNKSAEFIHKLSENKFHFDEQTVGACPHTTWEDLFVKDSEMRQLRTNQIEACAGMMLQTIKACGLGGVTMQAKSTLKQNVDALLSSPQLVKTVFNDVDHLYPGGDLAYLSNMASIHNDTNGFVFCDTPHLGVTIYKANSSIEPPKARDGTPLVGVPVSVGHVRSLSTHNKEMRANELDALTVRMPFCWDHANNRQYNTLLSRSFYRKFDSDEWRSVAEKFGMSKDKRDVLHLKPIVVKMSSTEQPK